MPTSCAITKRFGMNRWINKADFKLRLKALGLSIVDAAEEIGVKESSIYNWRGGTPMYAIWWLEYKEVQVKLDKAERVFREIFD